VLTPSHFLVLSVLAREKSADAATIAAVLGFEPDEVVRLLDELADEGLVEPPRHRGLERRSTPCGRR
jgi:DNA-binding MarR family transcriptional regulator